MNKKIYEQYVEEKDTYDLFGRKLTDLIEGLLKGNNLEYQTITYRVKDENSFRNKVVKKNSEVIGKYKDIKDITDVCGVRVITYYSDTVDKVAELISDQFEVDEINTIDKRKALDPDKFGYLSLHYVISLKKDRLILPEYSMFEGIKVEVQIRSISQHTWAEIEHDLGYKNKKDIPKSIRRDFYRLASLLELVDKEFVEIRNKIDSYTSESEKNVNVLTEKTEIDLITLKLYMQSSETLMDFNKSISELLGRKLDTTVRDLSRIIEKLEYAGFKTIQEIDYEIRQNKTEIINLASNIVNGKFYPKGLQSQKNKYVNECIEMDRGIFYLCYYKVCKQGSMDFVKQYISKSNIVSMVGNDKLASIIMESYNDAIKSK